MNVICPRCCSAKIVKNGATHYGKQNHRCKECNRQFVLNNKHTIRAEIRKLISKSLLERNSLRAICRIFDISLTWLQAFAQSLWSQVPKRLGLTKKMIKKVKKMQVFGLQADEMWSFVGKKACKRWIWIVFDPIYRVLLPITLVTDQTLQIRHFMRRYQRNYEAADLKRMIGIATRKSLKRTNTAPEKLTLTSSKDSTQPCALGAAGSFAKHCLSLNQINGTTLQLAIYSGS